MWHFPVFSREGEYLILVRLAQFHMFYVFTKLQFLAHIWETGTSSPSPERASLLKNKSVGLSLFLPVCSQRAVKCVSLTQSQFLEFPSRLTADEPDEEP